MWPTGSFAIILSITVVPLALNSIAQESSTVVDTKLGRIRGWTSTSRQGRNYSAFTKIPYAKPPIGSLRFKNPVPYGKWEGELTAVDDNPTCLQINRYERTQSSNLAVHGTEDCLYLNVYVPQNAPKLLPVLFRIFGGAFQIGQSGPRHMADFMMDENVILATATYRVNIFGFLSLENETIPGNFGLKDAALALDWISKNIESFGGDPKRVVVFGESTGGASAHHFLYSPLTKNMITAAVSSSGTITELRSLGLRGTVRNKTLKFAQNLGCSSDILSCLQSLNTTTLLTEYNQTEFWGVHFRPCIEPDLPGAMIPKDPREMGSTSPWITSFTNGEFTNDLAAHPENDTSDLETIFGPNFGFRTELDLKPDKWDKIRTRYFKNHTYGDRRRTIAQIAADLLVIYPAFEALHRHPGVKYLYMFEHRGQHSILEMNSYVKLNTSKAGHAEELIYEFNMTPTVNNSNMNELDTKVSRDFIKMLTNLAYTQNPTPPNWGTQWKPWVKNEMLRITSEGFFMADTKHYEVMNDIYLFWKEILS